jgi:hypothetical protein
MFAPSMIKKVGEEGSAYLADWRRGAFRKVEKMEIAGRVGFRYEERGLESGGEDQDLDSEDQCLFLRSRLLAPVGARRSALGRRDTPVLDVN